MQSWLFQTGSIALPASRFLCEHLHQNLFRACISRIHAQVPLVTSGKLTEAFHQQIPCGIDVAVVARLASRARPKPDIQPQLIEYVPALRAGLARGIPAIKFDEDLVMPLALICESWRRISPNEASLIARALRPRESALTFRSSMKIKS
jgi:hypothetical protein